jgi:FAD/FMN-containing dehydrogenase
MMVVDLSCMREVKVDVERKVAIAQGGALWSDFDAATTQKGFVSVGGTVSHTGIGGGRIGHSHTDLRFDPRRRLRLVNWPIRSLH